MTFIPIEDKVILTKLMEWVEEWRDEPLDDPQIDDFYKTFGNDARIMRVPNTTTYSVGEVSVTIKK